MMVRYVHAQKAARNAPERYMAEVEIAPGEHCGSALRVQYLRETEKRFKMKGRAGVTQW